MNKMQKDKLKRLFSNYFKEIHKIYISGGFREESFYPCLKTLLEECSRLVLAEKEASVLVQPKRTEVGIPDFLIKADREIVGYIETKTPDENLKDVEDSEQLKRHRNSLYESSEDHPFNN